MVLKKLNTFGYEGCELAGVTQESDGFIGLGGIISSVFLLKHRIELSFRSPKFQYPRITSTGQITFPY